MQLKVERNFLKRCAFKICQANQLLYILKYLWTEANCIIHNHPTFTKHRCDFRIVYGNTMCPIVFGKPLQFVFLCQSLLSPMAFVFFFSGATYTDTIFLGPYIVHGMVHYVFELFFTFVGDLCLACVHRPRYLACSYSCGAVSATQGFLRVCHVRNMVVPLSYSRYPLQSSCLTKAIAYGRSNGVLLRRSTARRGNGYCCGWHVFYEVVDVC